MSEFLIVFLSVFIPCIILIWLAFKLYKKSDTAKSLMLIYMMKNHGPNSIGTIDLLQDILKKQLAKEGIYVSDISIVHEMGNRFQAIVTIDNESHQVLVIADNTGAFHYQFID